VIRLQIIERDGADLHATLRNHMRTGVLKTFSLEKRGKRVVHVSAPGWMNWSAERGVVNCEILSPRKPGYEWDFLRAFIGRLADKYAEQVASISISFPQPSPPPKRKLRKKKQTRLTKKKK
jgi:hypothetical protein